MTLTLEEIARRLYKPGWADYSEYEEALDALGDLTIAQREIVSSLRQRWDSKNAYQHDRRKG